METRIKRIIANAISVFLILSGANPILFYLGDIKSIRFEVIVILFAYLFLSISGLLLLFKNTLGIKVSIYATFLTLITVDTKLISYKLGGLFDFFIYFRSNEGIGISSQIGTRFALNFYNNVDSLMFGINIVSITILVFLMKLNDDR